MALSLFPDYRWDRTRRTDEQLKGLWEPLKKKSSYSLSMRIGLSTVDLLRHLPGYSAAIAIAVPFLKNQKEIRAFILFGAATLAVSRVSLVFSNLFQKIDEGKGKTVGKALQFAESTSFIVSKIAISFFYFWTTTRLFHELGHAVFAAALFQNSFPRIELSLTSQKTVYFPQSLTPFGTSLGWKQSLLLYAAGGVIFDLVHDLFVLVFAHFSKDGDMATEANILVGMNALKNGAYAVSALWFQGKKVSHDFLQMQLFGKIDPLLAAIGCLAFPVIVKIGLNAYTDMSAWVRNGSSVKKPPQLIIPEAGASNSPISPFRALPGGVSRSLVGSHLSSPPLNASDLPVLRSTTLADS